MNKFCSLHNYSHFSLLQSLISPKDLFTRAKDLGQSAVAITDSGSLAASWDALKASRETGVKLVIGCEFYFRDSNENKEQRPRFIVLIAKNYTGYQNLLHLNKDGFDNPVIITKKVFPCIDWNLLRKYSDGIICLTGCANGIIGQLINNKNFDEAESSLKKLVDIYGNNLGVEVQTHNLVRQPNNYTIGINQQFTNAHAIRLAEKLKLRVVPTNSARYLKREQAKIEDALLAIGSMQPTYSNARLKFDTSDMYLKSYDEVKAFFSRNYNEEFADKICENTIYFSDLCEKPDWIEPKFSNPGGKELPVFPLKDEKDYPEFCEWMQKQSNERKALDEDKNFLRFRCEKELVRTGLKYKEEYVKRFEEELDVLYYCGTSSYILITADFMNWARNNGVSVGPGRGSAGGSLVAYLLGIHIADPIKYKLVFERFFSKKRTSFADIDNDISKEKRELVIDYIIKKYGKDKFAQVNNFIYITPKVYVKDLCRSLELGGDRKNAVKLGADISAIIPDKIDNVPLRYWKDAIKHAPVLSEYIKRYPQIDEYKIICEKPRANGVHASGIVISNRPVSQVVPIRVDKDNITSIQLDKDRAEEAGIVKIDILGLETLDIIEKTNELIKQGGKQVPKVDYEAYDKKTYDLITSGNTFGVFQFGTSAGTIDLCKKIKPKSIDDLAIITTLARPASKEIREDFIQVRENKKEKKLLHPSLENALKHTYGFPLYDESLLILAKDVAGWELDEADKLRKLTKEKGKNPEKAEKWRQEFIAGAEKNKIPSKTAIKIWHEIIEPFGKYSFNCSHAVLYSMISFHTAYLKAHFPTEFLLANLMYEVRSTNAKVAKKNIEKIKQEIRKSGIRIDKPNINKSGITYQIQKDGSLLTGLEAIKNAGNDPIEDIMLKRPFTSFDDFMIRSDSSKMRSNTIQALAISGCFGEFNIPRHLIYLYCSDYKKKLQVWLKKHDPKVEKFEYAWPVEKEWELPELYALEIQCMGEAFVCRKDKAFGNGNFFDGKSTKIKDIKLLEDKTQIQSIKAEIKDIFVLKVKKETSKYLGQDMLKCMCEDEYGDQISLTIFPKTLIEVKDRIKYLSGGRYKFEEGIAIHFSGSVNHYMDDIGIVLENIHTSCPPPAVPKNLKAKKTVKKISIIDSNKKDTNDLNDLMSDIEDDLFNEGLIDLDDED
jgi:DNA polymerase-3 subunit alpha